MDNKNLASRPTRANSPTKCAPKSAKQELTDRLLPSEAINLVSALVGAYPNGQPHDPKGYIGTIARLLCQFPRRIATECADPIHGVTRKTKFLPTVAEVAEWCEPKIADMHRTTAREDRIELQLADRKNFEDRGGRQTFEEIKADMANRGVFIGRNGRPQIETPETVKAKLNITDEAWRALPPTNAKTR
jgi:hypothetical protein